MGLAAVPDRGSRSARAHARDPLRGDCGRSGDRRRADRKPARDGSGAPRRGAPPGPQPLDRPLAPRSGARARRGRRARGRPALAPTGLRLSARRLVGEASPGYLFHPLAPERVRATVSDAKLIALLRDPVDRALSHYHHEVALGREPLTFEEAIEAEPERTRGEEERLAREPGYFSHAWRAYTYLARCP